MIQALLPFLLGGRNTSGFRQAGGMLGGLAQGGGFGLGYGFMVRAGYDLYGHVKDKILNSLGFARYTPDTATSMVGTGGLMGLNHAESRGKAPSQQSFNGMLTTQQHDSLARKLGGAHKVQNYLQSRNRGTHANPSQGSKTVRVGNRTFTKRISPHTGRLETDAQFHTRINKTLSGQKSIRYTRGYGNFLKSMHHI